MALRGAMGVGLVMLMGMAGCAPPRATEPADARGGESRRSLTGPIILPDPSQVFADLPQSP
jgi:hypothetical protein